MKKSIESKKIHLVKFTVLIASLISSIALADDPKADEKIPAAVESAKGEESDTGEQRQTALVSTMILKVINPSETRVALEKKVAELGGFPVLITDDSLTLKVPPKELSKVVEYAAKEGIIIEKSLARQDLTLELAQLEGELKSKRKILKRLRGFFDDSNVNATLRIEQTMTDLVAEIESVKGRLRVLRERAKWARVEISFQFKRRDRIIYVNSPFDWLNTVSLDRFLEEF
ncbi:MAG: DUF4349 domain-containing protein [Deltaproteobacteria bacterium]|nr:DUF4349 domain-containing protein [Deltaproteobacteria bacterium]